MLTVTTSAVDLLLSQYHSTSVPPERELFCGHQLLVFRVTAMTLWLDMAWGSPNPIR